MPISGKRLHGKLGGNLIGGLFDIDARESGDNLDATTAADEGGLRDETGCGRLTCRIKGYFDVSTGTVTPVRRGTAVTDLHLYLSENEGGSAVDITDGLVQECAITGQVRDRVMFEATIVSQGTGYDMP